MPWTAIYGLFYMLASHMQERKLETKGSCSRSTGRARLPLTAPALLPGEGVFRVCYQARCWGIHPPSCIYVREASWLPRPASPRPALTAAGAVPGSWPRARANCSLSASNPGSTRAAGGVAPLSVWREFCCESWFLFTTILYRRSYFSLKKPPSVPTFLC